MKELESAYASSSFVGSTLSATSSSTSFKVKECGNFTYTDPIDKSVSKNQGLYTTFEDGSRFVVRLSGTGSQGATIRLYVEKYSKDASEYDRDTQEGLKPLIEVALATSKLVEHTGRKEPTVITVSKRFRFFFFSRCLSAEGGMVSDSRRNAHTVNLAMLSKADPRDLVAAIDRSDDGLLVPSPLREFAILSHLEHRFPQRPPIHRKEVVRFHLRCSQRKILLPNLFAPESVPLLARSRPLRPVQGENIFEALRLNVRGWHELLRKTLVQTGGLRHGPV